MIATEHDSVYAFDADSGDQFWHIPLPKAGESPSDDRNCVQITPEIGITSTPVIDGQAGPHGTIYAAAMSKDQAGNYFQRLHGHDGMYLVIRPGLVAKDSSTLADLPRVIGRICFSSSDRIANPLISEAGY